MRPLELALAAVTLVLGFCVSFPPHAVRHADADAPQAQRIEPGAGAAGRTPRIECEHPATLRLRRFEDGSARLECAGRPLVRVSVPG
jgi:hypothetical protein